MHSLDRHTTYKSCRTTYWVLLTIAIILPQYTSLMRELGTKQQTTYTLIRCITYNLWEKFQAGYHMSMCFLIMLGLPIPNVGVPRSHATTSTSVPCVSLNDTRAYEIAPDILFTKIAKAFIQEMYSTRQTYSRLQNSLLWSS